MSFSPSEIARHEAAVDKLQQRKAPVSVPPPPQPEEQERWLHVFGPYRNGEQSRFFNTRTHQVTTNPVPDMQIIIFTHGGINLARVNRLLATSHRCPTTWHTLNDSLK